MPEKETLYLGEMVKYDGTCPHCGARFQSGFGVASSPVGTKPKPGSINVCTVCRNPSKIEADGTLRRMTTEEKSAFWADPRAMVVLEALGTALPPDDHFAVRRGRR
jgi:phage terminase large subunit GpA-like protein